MKKTISLLLAVVMIFSLLPTAVFAVGAAPFESVASISGKTITVSLKTSGNLSYANLTAKISVSDGLTCTSIEKGANYSDFNANDPVVNPSSGIISLISKNLSSNTEVDSGKELCVFTVDASSAADGEYNFSVEFTAAANIDGDALDWQKASITSNTVTVGNSTPATQGYELYYTLNSSTDSDSDKYIDYDVGSTVTATIYLKSNLADTLQAFDLYITNGANLTYSSYSSEKGTRITSGTAASNATSQHIQAVGADKNNPINVTLPAGEGVAIATVTYTISSDAVYNTGLPITITDASNIAVANTPASFTPNRGTDVLGAEVMTTYTVSYGANGGSGAPADQTKQYNVALTLSSTKPTREGYTFIGWNTNSSATTAEYSEGGSYTKNEAAKLYAIWEAADVSYNVEHYQQNTDLSTYPETPTDTDNKTAKTGDSVTPEVKTYTGFTSPSTQTGTVAADGSTVVKYYYTRNSYTITWKNEDGTVLETDTNVPYGTTPSYDSSTPTKDATAQYTYTFKEWSPAVTTATANATYTATYNSTTNTYTVTFTEGDHGTLVDGDKSKTADYNASITLPTPSVNDGYTFDGWYSGDTKIGGAGDSYTVTGDITLTAKYTANKYTVKFDGNGATSGTMNDQEFTYDVAQALTSNAFEKTGSTFNGWNTQANGNGTSYTNGQSVSNLTSTNNGEVTLYAQWSNNNYTVSVDTGITNGTVSADKNSANYNDTITVTVTPNAGYEIDSVSYTPDGGSATPITVSGATGTFTMPAAHVTVTATFKAIDYTVTVETAANGSATASKTTANVGEEITLTYTPATGYKFKSVTVKDASNNAVTVTDNKFTMPASNVTVTPEFEPISYTIAFDNGGGSGTMDPISAVYGTDYTLTANTFTKTGYDFDGWKDGNGNTYTDGQSVSNLTADDSAIVTLTAQWKAHTYTVTYKANGGTGEDVTQNVAYGDTTAVTKDADTFTKTGYTLTSWNTVANAEGGTSYAIGADLSAITSNLELYAQWTANTYTVTFYKEDGTTVVQTVTYTYGDTSITEPAVPTKDGYTGAWGSYDLTKAENQTVTPTYTPIQYTITFETDGGTEISAMTYTIESTDTLPSATGKTNYSFENWKVTTPGGNWAADAVIKGDTQVKGKYGDVTLTAQWTVSLSYALEEYKYAPAGYKLLLIDAAGAGDGKVYKYDGADMYYIADENYKFGDSTAVFYTLVQESSFSVDKIAASAGTQQTITYDGDINGDGKVNIADANAIFQMVFATGTYYSTDQLTIAQRLAADMVKSTDNAEHRGSIEDVNAVVALINGTN